MIKKEILFSYFPKYSYTRYQTLLKAFSNLDNAWQADYSQLKKTGWKSGLIHEFVAWKNHLDEEKINQVLKKENINPITIDDSAYPPLLRQTYDPPLTLFVRGALADNGPTVAIVGTRKCSSYARKTVKHLLKQLIECYPSSRNGLRVASGLALGIDGLVHWACLKNNCRTIAVLGGGVNKDHVYPAAHKRLSERILEQGGALISEYPPGALPSKFTFPKRNRVIAGISLATVVIEAPETSGALITAQSALDNNREVFALPHPIDSESGRGGNRLIQSGAHPLLHANDIIKQLNLNNKIIQKNME